MLKLPKLSRAELDLYNAIARYSGGSVRIAQCDWQITLQALPTATATLAQLHFLVDSEPCYVGLRQRWLQQLLAHYLDDTALAELAPELALMVIDALLAPLLEQAEQALDVSIKLESLELAPVPLSLTQQHITISFHAQSHDSQTQAGQLILNEALAIRLSQWLSQQAHKAPLDWSLMPIIVRFELGTTMLDIANLHDLAVADVVLLEQGAWLQETALTVRIGSTIAYRAHIEKDQIVLQARENPMTETAASEASELSDLAELPIKLSFELAEQTLPLSEVQKLHIEHTFALPTRPEQAVRVCANGRCIGIGELVQIDDYLGVRLVQLHTQTDA